jgi:hypothetical protein
MARQVSWESRLHEIRRSVANSVRSHYDRRDLELLFKLQPRAAGKLLETLPTVSIGRSQLVLREVLSLFLEGASEAEDVAGYCAAQKAKRKVRMRRKPRSLVRRDLEPVAAASLSTWLTPGLLTVPYKSLEELVDVLWRVASALQDDVDQFSELYEAHRPHTEGSDPSLEVRRMFEELAKMERDMELRNAPPSSRFRAKSGHQMATNGFSIAAAAVGEDNRGVSRIPHSPPEKPK